MYDYGYSAAQFAYDNQMPQEKSDTKNCACAVCGYMYYDEDITQFPNGDEVCADCKPDYLRSKSAEHSDEYIEQNANNAAAVWFKTFLKEDERDAIILSLFNAELARGSAEISEFKETYCNDSEGFIEFVEKAG